MKGEDRQTEEGREMVKEAQTDRQTKGETTKREEGKKGGEEKEANEV